MQHPELTIAHLHAEADQQIAALVYGKMQVTVAGLAQLSGHPQLVEPQRGIGPARQHQLGGPDWPPLDKIGHVTCDSNRRRVEVVDNQG
jgi:hypothetical protein